MCEFVNLRCRSSNTVTATSLLIIMDSVVAVLALICGGFAVQVGLSCQPVSNYATFLNHFLLLIRVKSYCRL